MFHSACRITLAVVFCLILVQPVAAGDIEVAKVYRDYPGYIEPPTCENPRLKSLAGRPGSSAGWLGICPRAWTLTPMLGYHFFDGGLDLDDEVSFGLAIGYNLTSNWALEADLRFTPSQTDFKQGNNRDVDVWIIGGSVLYHFLPEQRLVPYLAVGGGGIIYDIEDAGGNDEDYMGYWGGGFKYAINNAMALRLDLRHILDYRNDDQDATDWRHQFSTMGGVTFQFGR